jgi:hypothetical protein
MTQTLSIFSWTPDNSEGFAEVNISNEAFDGYKELNLSQEEAQQLLTYIQNSLDNHEHITFRLIEGD